MDEISQKNMWSKKSCSYFLLHDTDKLIFLDRRNYHSKMGNTPFFDTFRRDVEIYPKTRVFRADFPAVKIGRRIFLKNPLILAPKSAFSKKICETGAEIRTPVPCFLALPIFDVEYCIFSHLCIDSAGGRITPALCRSSCHTIAKADKALCIQVAIVRPSRPDAGPFALLCFRPITLQAYPCKPEHMKSFCF